jgi:hypothetical protein
MRLPAPCHRPGDGADRVGDIRRICRATYLIVHYPQPVAFRCKAKHRAYEIASKRRVDPGRAQDNVPWVRLGDSQLARQLGAAIDALRVDRIALDIGAGLGPVEDVISRQVNYRNALRSGSDSALSTAV